MREALLHLLAAQWIRETPPIPLAYGPLFLRLIMFPPPPVSDKARFASWGKVGTVNPDGSVTWGDDVLTNAGSETPFGQIRSALIDALSNGRRTGKLTLGAEVYLEFCVGTNPAE